MALFGSLIAANRVKSGLVVSLFVLLYTVLFFGVVFGLALFLIRDRPPVTGREILLVALASHAAAVLLVLLVAAGSTRLVLWHCGAEPVPRAEAPQLHNVVEEVAVAAGMSVPRVCRIDSSSANALAVGLPRGKEAIIVTRGLLERLDRDELQAVVAHQMARLKNGDIQLMTIVAGLAGLAAMLRRKAHVAVVGLILLAVLIGLLNVVVTLIMDLRADTLADLQRNPRMPEVSRLWPMAGLPVYLLIAGAMAGRLIQFGVSRERLFLADAEAARMTRYPEALVGALEKMDADTTPLLSASAATAHLFTVSPLMVGHKPAGGAWSSHPPVEERVERLRSIGGAEA